MNKDGVKVNNGTMLNFKMGAVAGLSSQTLTPGTVYVTTDERAMYIDLQNERIRLGDFNVYATLADLQAETHFSQTALYYVQNTGILYACVNVSDNSADLKPINDVAGLTEAVSGLQTTIATKADKTALESAVNTINGELALKATKAEVEAAIGEVNDAIGEVASDLAETDSAVSGLQTTIATKADQSALESAVTTINGEIAKKADKTTVEALDAAYKAADTAIGTRIGAVETSVSGLSTTMATKADKSELEGAVSTINGELAKKATNEALNEVKTDLADAEKEIDERIDGVDATISGIQAAVATKADKSALESAVGEINAELAKKATTEALNKAKSDLADADTALGKRIDGVAGDVSGLQSAVATKAEQSALTSAVETINGELALKATKAELAEEKAALEEAIGEVAEELGKTNETVSGHGTAIANINTDLALKATKSELENAVSTINGNVDKKADKTALEKVEKDYQAADSALAGDISGLQSAVATKAEQSALTNAVNTINGEIAKKADKTTVEDLDAAYKAADVALGGRIDGVQGDIGSLQSALALKANDADIKALIGVNTSGKVSDGTTTADSVVAFVNDKFTAFNAMTFKGSVAKYENLPATANAGDTYLLSANDAGYAAGDLFVANADGAASWTHVPSGYNQIHEQKLQGDSTNKQIQLYNATNTSLTTAFTVATEGAVTATVTDGTSPTLTIGMAWGTF